MSELKPLRLAAAATQYNVSAEHIMEKLQASGFELENKPTVKLTVEMVQVLEKAFNKDRAIKQEADSTKIDKVKNEVLEIEPEVRPSKSKVQEEEKQEILIKSNLIHAPEPVAPPQTPEKKEEKEPEQEVPAQAPPAPADKIETRAPKLTGPKVLQTIDLDKGKKGKPKETVAPVAAKEEPVQATSAPQAEKPVEEPAVEPAPAETQSPETVEVVAPPPAPEPAKPAAPAEPEIIRAQRRELEGPKTVGKIILEDPRARKKKDDTPAQGAAGSAADQARRKRKRIPGKGGQPVQPDTAGKTATTERPQHRRRDQPQTAEEAVISEKEIQDKIRETMKRIAEQTGGKSDRSKYRRDKRVQIAEKQADEQVVRSGVLKVTEFMTVSELAHLMEVSPTEVIKSCMELGVMVSINQRLDAEIIDLVAGAHGFTVEFQSIEDQTAFEAEVPDAPEDLQTRAPIVTIMGHVDHGKTSLLDYIRKANVAAKEAGGITQHIGAYEVETSTGRKITFLDTPGHEAFTAMRARGAKVTDVSVIVVAADDAVMPQTREAISHSQAAGVPMVFAINKVDKDGANPEKIKEQLANMNLLVEDWGGTYQSQEISAKKGLNVDLLLEKILIQSDMLELKANPDKEASGTLIEATLDKGRGYTATLLVTNGTLHRGDMIVCGKFAGRIKAMFDHAGRKIESAGPATPVQVLGLNGAPQAGELFKVFEDEQAAKELATRRDQLMRETKFRTKKHITLEEIGRRLALGNFKELNLIVKGDVDGSVEALSDSLLKLGNEQIQVRIVHKGVGQISEADVNLAIATDAIILGFNVRPSQNARVTADNENIEIKTYSVIYSAIDDVKNAMEGMLEPKIEEKIVGNVEVREVFRISKVGPIAGCFVRDGKIARNSKIRIIRQGIVIHNGLLSSLKRFKDDVKEVASGLDCGLQIKDFQDINAGDHIEVYEEVEIARKL